MKKFIIFPEIELEMEKRGETQEDLAKILELDRTQVCRKLSGDVQWSIGDIEVMTHHYNKDFWELFRRNKKEDKNENTI